MTTTKQLRLIRDIEATLGKRYKGTNTKDASKFIRENMDNYQYQKAQDEAYQPE